MKRLILAVSILLLTGCAPEEKAVTHEIKIPLYIIEEKNLREELVVTRGELKEARDALKTVQGKQAIEFTLSAYSPYDDVNGINSSGTGLTSTGTKPKLGTFAVDPNVIPYGSKIMILYPDGSVEYGVAEDCGGMIKGNRIDLFRYTYKEAIEFGKRKAMVIWWTE